MGEAVTWRRATAWIPRGRPLPPQVWAARHRWVVVILAVQAAAIPFYALYRGDSPGRAMALMVAPAAMAGLACWTRLPDRVRGAVAAMGLMVVSGIVVVISNGAIEAHFHYFVMIPIAALYQDWVPFGVAIGYVLVQHGIVGRLDPSAVYDHHDAQQHPWLWAGVHAGYMTAACLAAVANWTFHERSREVEGSLTAALHHQVHHDALTGLPNRTLFLQRLDRQLEDSPAAAGPPTVLMLDLDGFKDVNDTYGHHFGDLLLVQVARRLLDSMGEEDTVTRLSGDEFAVLLATSGDLAGEQAADRMITALTEVFRIEEMEVDIEVSIGIATADPGDASAAVLRKADTAMYVAKQQRLGRTRFAEGHRQDTTTRLNLLATLRRALRSDEIVLHYQPQVSLTTGEVVGVEALARWQHPTRGLLAPSEFIPILERTSMSHAFTVHVLTTAVRQTRQWLDRGIRLPLAVNVSTRCLLDPDLVDVLTGLLRTTGVPGELVCVEITENSVVSDPERAMQALRAIRALGARVALDDYGTGYSSMAYLKMLPVDLLKVDHSLISDLVGGGQQDAVLVRSVIDLGHALGLQVVAEGVENAHVMVTLKKLGCDLAQGYHLSRPLTAPDLEVWLARRGAASRAGDAPAVLPA
jgi:diguanylate cyclase (GGDEF)-like protein